MKKRATRILAFALAVVLCLPLLPVQAKAALDLSSFEAFKRQAMGETTDGSMKTTTDYGEIEGDWSDETFRRGSMDVNFFELDEIVYSCMGFTMEYMILEVHQGNMLSGDFIFEVYARTTGGSWKSVDSFYLKEDYEKTVTVNFDEPMSIDAVAVVCGKQSKCEFTYTFTLKNAVRKKSSLPTSGTLSGCWLNETFRRGDYTTQPFELNSSLTRCKGFTLYYEITEVTKGSLDGDYRCEVYVRTTAGKWKYVADFKMKGYDTCQEIRFDPISIDAVAVFYMKPAKMTYSFDLAITDPV